MVVPLLVSFSALLFIVCPAGAQIFAANCSDTSSDWEWSFNSLGQDPCLVAAYLASVCNNGAFTLPRLPPQHSYTGPNGLDNGDMCKCNTVVYNLISACDACQGEPWFAYSKWNYNCTVTANAGTFPEPVPAETRVPHWAFLDPTATDDWDLQAAQLAGDPPEVTGSVPLVPTSTKKSQSTVAPKAPSPPSLDTSSNGSSNSGKIAGGVVGGIVGVALTACIVLWFIIRRRRAHAARSSGYYIDGQSNTWKETASGKSYFSNLGNPELI